MAFNFLRWNNYFSNFHRVLIHALSVNFQVVTDGFSAEKATANSAEMRALQTGDVSYKEQSAATAARARVELDGVSAEKSVAAARVSSLVKLSMTF